MKRVKHVLNTISHLLVERTVIADKATVANTFVGASLEKTLSPAGGMAAVVFKQ